MIRRRRRQQGLLSSGHTEVLPDANLSATAASDKDLTPEAKLRRQRFGCGRRQADHFHKGMVIAARRRSHVEFLTGTTTDVGAESSTWTESVMRLKALPF